MVQDTDPVDPAATGGPGRPWSGRRPATAVRRWAAALPRNLQQPQGLLGRCGYFLFLVSGSACALPFLAIDKPIIVSFRGEVADSDLYLSIGPNATFGGALADPEVPGCRDELPDSSPAGGWTAVSTTPRENLIPAEPRTGNAPTIRTFHKGAGPLLAPIP